MLLLLQVLTPVRRSARTAAAALAGAAGVEVLPMLEATNFCYQPNPTLLGPSPTSKQQQEQKEEAASKHSPQSSPALSKEAAQVASGGAEPGKSAKGWAMSSKRPQLCGSKAGGGAVSARTAVGKAGAGTKGVQQAAKRAAWK
jgi:hypothetical protein